MWNRNERSIRSLHLYRLQLLSKYSIKYRVPSIDISIQVKMSQIFLLKFHQNKIINLMTHIKPMHKVVLNLKDFTKKKMSSMNSSNNSEEMVSLLIENIQLGLVRVFSKVSVNLNLFSSQISQRRGR